MHRQQFASKPKANPSAIVGGDKFRFTVLTDGLLRYEWAPDNHFEDRRSVFAINRDLPVPQFRVKEKDDSLEIVTSRFHFTYDKEPFSPSGFAVVVKGTYGCHQSVWRFGEATPNLGGTARTLDEADGRIPLGPGVASRNGFSNIDDSVSMLFDADGLVASRRSGERVDGYIFAYGHDYRDAVKALYAISGSQPLLPRWALGNWWSRYFAYTADQYLDLMDKFKAEGIPLSVAVLDMDWHLVDDPKVKESGSVGWTGYSWNRKLFPDPPKFLSELHRRNLKITVNDHPADGVYSFEDRYEEMAKALDHDTSTKDPVQFDIVNQKFLNAYFDILQRGLEDDGIDFIWLDWQQGTHTKLKGIDPLWCLNHYAFLDNGRDHKRPLTFSRYAGPGSHRYPVGFSGDTIVTWASLDFQPEFTLTASNIGYGWWSHDIGGHMMGGKDDELVTRWVQLGAFSPILRLHSSNSKWTGKEPWTFGVVAQKVQTDFLRLRHRMLPYLYSMNEKAAVDNSPLVQPMYWDYPKRDEAYDVRNQYMFGSELIVIPITAPADPKLQLGRVRGWLPPGRYVDIFNGCVYDGDRGLWINRSLEEYPVFAREGSIVPLDASAEPVNGGENPGSFEILIAVGADGKFDIMEDDGTGSNAEEAKWARTSIIYTQSKGCVQIEPALSSTPIPTEAREWNVRFLALSKPESLRVLVDGFEVDVVGEKVSNGFLVKLGKISRDSKVSVEVGENPRFGRNDASAFIFPFLHHAKLEFALKERIWDIITSGVSKTIQVSRLSALDMDRTLLDAVLEFVLADSCLEV
ncbi:Alpha-xylosidase [Hyphodiscus hymeniophilus]|uniref:alpha-glucosidase n=1 Tax=Hyphodiscus hymeniophilus TaxID=353542 RepID=A0A9P6VQP2_9HELO|nr:Alpha-xylosidase [Hyphodiscus hymeniophilus]